MFKNIIPGENEMIGIVVHGGAGTIKPERQEAALNGVKKAVDIGYSLLKSGESSLSAVEAAVKYFEDDETFNAGRGSVLTIDGNVEMDAAIMDGATLNCGAVSLVRNVAHPISLARLVMEKTNHVLIAGEFAEKIAKAFNLEFRDQKTERSIERYKEALKKFKNKELSFVLKNYELLTRYSDLLGTVGAVAVDKMGNVAAATSTGGFILKLPGRIGDTPQIGAGTYADNLGAAVSATGFGEVAIRLVIAYKISNLVRGGTPIQKAVEYAMKEVVERQNGLSMGAIAIDRFGNYGVAHTSKNISWAVMRENMTSPKAGLEAVRIT